METCNEILKVAIDPDGDTIFVLEGTELQVSSKVLSLASVVFTAMFGPHFLEGKHLNSTNPRRVPLPEDDGGAMTALCNILHHRAGHVDKNLSSEQLEKLATVVDKYDCSQAITPWSGTWIAYVRQAASTIKEINRLVFPFYAFNDPDSFKEITRLVVYHTVGFLATPEVTGSLPDGIFGKPR